MGSIIQATQALSSEMELEELLRELLRIVEQYAGARRSVLALNENDNLIIRAHATVQPNNVQVALAVRIDDYQQVPATVIRLVKRTHEDVVIDDALQPNPHDGDPYIQAKNTRSILCTPLLEQGKLLGILYLENDLTAGAFTPDRIEVLRLISSQAAISIANATLYSKLRISMKRVARLEQERLMTKLSRFQAVIEASSDFISLISLSGELLYINQTGLSLVEHLGENYTGQSILRVFSESVADRVMRRLLPEVRERGSWTGELSLLLAPDVEVPVSVALTLVRNAQGEPTGFGMIARDISDAKRIQQELQQARDDAETANRAKGDFLAYVSHEIRTPMNAVIGMADLLLASPLDRKQSRYTKIIHDSGESLLSLINDILDLSKIEAQQQLLEFKPFSVRRCVESAMSLMVPGAMEKAITLSRNLASSVPQDVMGDENKVRQILVNLLGNALKFTEQGYISVRVEASRQRAGNGGKPNDELCTLKFSVTDTGMGIAPDRIEEMFQPYRQADASTTRKYGGTGLGLAISRQLVDNMDGEMWAESTPGKGSTFYFTIVTTMPPSAKPAFLDEDTQDNDHTALEPKPIISLDTNLANELPP